MTPEQIIQNAILYLPPRSLQGLDVGDVARLFPNTTTTKNNNDMMNFETGGGELVWIDRPRHCSRIRRTNNNALPATPIDELTAGALPGDEQEAFVLAGARAFNAYRSINRQSRWIRAALFVLLVVAVVKIVKS
jgi:hypothetical protein